ncbi:MAG: endopeptidase La [Deltaproteobacteria bacterium]|nr:endopeptidase La [Deltaproteobacteria bacterium]
MSERRSLPVIALRNTVIFPGLRLPISVGRSLSVHAIEEASGTDQLIFAVAQKKNEDTLSIENLFDMGVVARIVHVQHGQNSLQVLLEGHERGKALEYRHGGDRIEATVMTVNDIPVLRPDEPVFVALLKETRERAVELGKKRGVPEHLLARILEQVKSPGVLADVIAAYLEIGVEDKQALLETTNVENRLRRVLVHVQRLLAEFDAQQKIQSDVQEELGSKQREMFLRQQMKAIQKELGEDREADDVEELRERLAKLDLPKEARAETDRELARLERAGRDSVESQVIRNYLEWISELPWNKRSDDNLDLKRAAEILEEDHYGLSEVKDRVLEFLAIRQLRAKKTAESKDDELQSPAVKDVKKAKARALAKGPILLFVGPPGVGKTSIVKSIARALNREYVRIALGGARDEADIRGHRRTYVGAMPGRIVQGLKQAGKQNPVFLLDEIDKLGVSYQGNPASALMEVLDPAQNDSFTDHYLNVPFNLSEVLFVATANFIENIPSPLLDRMEVVEFSGYTEREKAEIAKRYLVPRQLEEAGLSGEQVAFSDEALLAIISSYTRESGVRQLERRIASVTRKVARKLAADEPTDKAITPESVRLMLGRPKVRPERANETDDIGVATGLYYTPAGGDIMFVEASIRRLHEMRLSDNSAHSNGWGNVSLILTGQLGDVMKESARAAMTYAAMQAKNLFIPEDKLGSIEAHIHVPAGAIPKDGPSAGVAIATALASAMAGIPVRKDVAMTGEITLRGRVLPIGGVKEKVLGALRAGIKKVILPRENEADLEDLPKEARDALEFICVDNLDDVFRIALLSENYFPTNVGPLGSDRPPITH